MNYRHAFHAGNFADVVKHASFARILEYLKEKPAAFRVIDSHAGAGRYDLSGPEASRTGEWREGIGKLLAADRARDLSADVRALLAPYLDVVRAMNDVGGHSAGKGAADAGAVTAYPGSPALAQALMREDDRLTACELEPNAARDLAAALRGDRRASAVAIDGYTALNAYVPPKERRGVVLIDPPFEAEEEHARLGEALAGAHRKWPTGIYVLWYPIKDERETEGFGRRLKTLGISRMLRAELVLTGRPGERLRGSGLVVVNPPWTLEAELQTLLPALATVLSDAAAPGSRTRVDWLVAGM